MRNSYRSSKQLDNNRILTIEIRVKDTAMYDVDSDHGDDDDDHDDEDSGERTFVYTPIESREIRRETRERQWRRR